MKNENVNKFDFKSYYSINSQKNYINKNTEKNHSNRENLSIKIYKQNECSINLQANVKIQAIPRSILKVDSKEENNPKNKNNLNSAKQIEIMNLTGRINLRHNSFFD